MLKDKVISKQINESNGFRLFTSLIIQLGDAENTQVKIALLTHYFSVAPDADKLWTIGLLSGRKQKRVVKTSLLSNWVTDLINIPPWLFEECYQHVGDLAETISLLLWRNEEKNQPWGNLADYLLLINSLSKKSDQEKKEIILACWHGMNDSEKIIFNKLITGVFRVGVSAQLVIQSLAILLQEEPAVLAHRLSGQWAPDATQFDLLVKGQGAADNHSQPYPFILAEEIEEPVSGLGEPSQWFVEWKWDGIRGQVIKRNGQWFVWSREEELITEKFPEFEEMSKRLPDGTVLDGVILAMSDGKPLQSSILQTRIARIKVTQLQRQLAPVHFMAFDLLECQGVDWRSNELHIRRKKLSEIISNFGYSSLLLSPEIKFSGWDQLAELRLQSRNRGCEGLMLKRKESGYQVGRKKGDWWKWKNDPLAIDAVLIYAQQGLGRRGGLFTDYTFAVKDGNKLVSFARANSGLTDDEIKEVDAFIRKNSIEKFGPVRTVKPELVFEIAFEGISESKRHKSGITVRFPRIIKWRTDKKSTDINTLEDLKDMLRN